MAIDWRPLADLVHAAKRFVLTTHIRPDGDGLGSMLALAAGLEQRGKLCRLIIAGTLPVRYQFLDPDRRIQSFTGPISAQDLDALIVLDTGTWNQLAPLADWIRGLGCPKAVIDHHITQDDLGAVRLVDTSAEACGRLVHDALLALGCRLTPDIAGSLFTALAMDTGWFRHNNTTSRTLALAGELVAAGARPEKLYQELFEQSSLPRLKLMGQVLARLTTAAQGKIAHSAILKSDYELTGATPPDSEDLVNFTLSLSGVQAGLLFMEQPRGGVKVSLRGRSGVDVGQVAEQFGGGGHAQAAGAIVEGEIDRVREQVLAAVERIIA